jgi:guanylate kinase
MIVIVGESGSGKSTLQNYIVKNSNYKKIITYTTRKPRVGEQDGVDYHYISEEEFNELVKKDFFVEHATYNGWHYGTAKEDCKNNSIAVLTPRGLRQLKKQNDIDIISIYICVPRRDRLIKILERGDNIEEAYRRSLSDVGQYDGISDEVDFVIHNDCYKYSVNTMSEMLLNYILFKTTKD